MTKVPKYQLTRWILLASVVLNLGMHWPFLSQDIQGYHAMRQAQTMWNIHNFYRYDGNILNPRVNFANPEGPGGALYRYEFPVMQWSIAMAQELLGVEDILIVRVCLFLIGVLGAIGFFLLLRTLSFSPLVAALGAAVFQFSPLFYRYSINPIPDNFALTAGIWYLYLIFRHENQPNLRDLIGASAALLLATWAKLPFLMFSMVSVVYFFRRIILAKGLTGATWRFAGIQFLFILPALLWYAWVMPGWEGNGILRGVFDNQLPWADTKRILLYHLDTMIPWILLSPAVWLPFVLGVLFFRRLAVHRSGVLALVGITLLYFFLQYNMIETIHDYYMLPFLPWLYVLVAIGLKVLWQMRHSVGTVVAIAVVIAAPISAYLLANDSWSLERTYLNEDLFVHRQELRDAVPEGESVIIVNDATYFNFAYQIDKLAYVYRDDYLPTPWIADLAQKGVNYLYSDSRAIDERPDVQPYLDSLILEAGSVRVYRLQPVGEKE